MKHFNKQSSVFTLSVAFILFMVVLVSPLIMNADLTNPSGVTEGTILPMHPQPSAQSSGLSADILGIPTGNDAGASPMPDINSNRSGSCIFLGFGQVVYDQTDLIINGRDDVTKLLIARRHLSRIDQTKAHLSEGTGALQEVTKHAPFGPSWAFNYGHTITRCGEDVLMYSYGRRDLFKRVGATDVWEGTEGRFGRLTYDTTSAPAKYILRMPHGTLLEFEADHDADGKPAHLTKITSPNALNTLSFTYEEQAVTADILQRKLLRITDSFGRTVSFTYADSKYPQGVSTITISSILGDDDRTLQYEYTSEGQLLTMRSPVVTSPNGINDFPEGKQYQYRYYQKPDTVETLNPALKVALTAVIFPNQVADGTETPAHEWTYDADTSATNAYLAYVKTFKKGEGTFSYTYRAIDSLTVTDVNKAVREVTVTDRTGTTIDYKTNRMGQVLIEKINTRGLRSGVSASYVKSFKYNNDGQLTSRIDPIGSKTRYFYTNRRDLEELNNQGESTGIFPNQSNPRTVEFPVTDVVRLPDARGGDQTLIRRRTIYEPVFNHPFKAIDPRGLELGADASAFTTTLYYDYMEDLQESARQSFASLLGIDQAAFEALLTKAGIDGVADLNSDTLTDQAAGNLIKIVHPTVAALPEEAAKLTNAVSVPLTAEQTFRYNSFGQNIQHQDAEGNVLIRSYYNATGGADSEGGGYLHEIVRDAGSGNLNQTTTYEYVAQNVNLEKDSSPTDFPANSFGVPTAVTDPRGVKTACYVNQLDQVLQIVHAYAVSDNLTPFSYETFELFDANNNVKETRIENEDSLTDAPGAANSLEGVDDLIITTATFDLLNQMTASIIDVGDGNNGKLSIQSTYSYDLNQNVTGISRGDPLSTVRDEYIQHRAAFDERDMLIYQILAAEEVEQARFEQEVDAAGNIKASVDAEDVTPESDAEDGALGGDVTRMVYDGFNRKRQETDREGNTVKYTYDSNSNVVKVEVYGPIASVSSDSEPASESLLEKTEMFYDSRNRVFREDKMFAHYDGQEVGEIHDADSQASDGKVSTFTLYDRTDRVVGTLDGEEGLKQFFYDGLSRITRTIDEAGNRVEYTYDSGCNVTQRKSIETENSDDPTPQEFLTQKKYDALNRIIESVEPNGELTAYKYDSRNNLVQKTDARGNVVEYTYDRNNRLVQKDTFLSADGTNASRDTDLNVSGNGKITLRFVRDDHGQVVEAIDANGARVSYEYNDRHFIKASYADGSTEEYTYNGDGDVLTCKDRNGTTVTRTYDANSRLIGEVVTADANASLERSGSTKREWKYDGKGRLIRAFDNNNPSTTDDDVTCLYVYDSFSRVIKETQRIGDTNDDTSDLVIQTEWEGDSLRKVLSTYPNGRQIARTYDESDRVSRIEEKATNQPIATFVYDGPTRTIGATYGNGTVLTKIYDNNRRSTETKWQKDGTSIVHYVNTYDSVNRRLSEQRKHLGSASIDTYTFDSSSRMIGFRQDGTAINTEGNVTVRQLDGADMMTQLTGRTLEVDGLDASGNGTSAAKLNRYTAVDGKARVYDANGNLDNQNSASDSQDLKFVQDFKNRIVSVNKQSGPLVDYVYDAFGRRVLKTVGTTKTRYFYDGWQVVEERSWPDNKVLRQYVDGRGIDEHIQMRVYTDGTEPTTDYYYHYNDQGFVGALTNSSGAVVEYYKYDWFGNVKILKGFE